MSGDNLSVLLFFAGLAVTFVVAGMSQAGWKHPVLIGSLFAIGGLSAIIAVTWPWIGSLYPTAARHITELASNPVCWFALVVFGMTAVLLLGRSNQHEAHATTQTERGEQGVKPSLKSQNLYHGRLEASFVNIDDLAIEVVFVIFNGSDTAARIEMGGSITYDGVINSGQKPVALPPPAFRSDTNRVLQPWHEHFIILDQRIPRTLANQIETGRRETTIMFNLKTLRIVAIPVDGSGPSIKVSLWDGFTCTSVFPNFTGRRIMATFPPIGIGVLPVSQS